jgi:hypothetical protein
MEKIRSAAIRKGGKVYVCWAHAWHEIKRMNLDYPYDNFRDAEQGFVTSNGRYVGRVEALKIATEANQVVKKHHPLNELLSEDLRYVSPDGEQIFDTIERLREMRT